MDTQQDKITMPEMNADPGSYGALAEAARAALFPAPTGPVERVTAHSKHNLSGLPASLRLGFNIIRHIAWGQLRVELPDGRAFLFGTEEIGHEAIMRVHKTDFIARFFRSGDIGFAEAYMDGDWSTPDLEATLTIFSQNRGIYQSSIGGKALQKVIFNFLHLMNRNSKSGSKRNISAHYDLGNEFYSEWLDQTMTYSSAKFDGQDMPLPEAQLNKYRSLGDQLALTPDHHVLEIGCGWGGFAEFAAKTYGSKFTCLTISREQHDFAKQRIQKAGLADQVEIRFQDYRDVEEKFDRVASIEMFEAVGESYWPVFFSKVRDCLEPGGRAGMQIITVTDDSFEKYRGHMDFIQKYIFPGGMLPSPRALQDQVAKAGMEWQDQITFGRDYARTLTLWHERFTEAWPRIQTMGFNQRFRRMWQFYLCYCAAAFKTGNCDVTQIAFGKN